MTSYTKNFAQQIITVFTTISVKLFNVLFTKLCNNLVALELQASFDSTIVQTLGQNLKNDMKTVYCILKYTQIVYSYNDFVQRGIW